MSRAAAQHTISQASALTGVPAPTLRAWERRYGIPEPQRTASGRRIYSDAEIDLIRRVRRLTVQGIPISVAAVRVRAAPRPRADASQEPDHYGALIDRIMNAIAAFDADRLDDELRRALLLGSSLDVYDRVMVPVMHRLGAGWKPNDPEALAQEHLTTEVMRSVAQDLLRLSRPKHPVGTAILAAFADELHVLPLYPIAFRLAQYRIRSIVLGARTPPAAIAVAVQRARPDLVALSLTVAPTAKRATHLLEAYGAACGDTPWLVGGMGIQPSAAVVRRAGGTVVDDAFDLEAFLDDLNR